MLHTIYRARVMLGVAAIAVSLMGISRAQAAIIVTATQSGNNVVFSGGGTADLTGLNFANSPGTTIGVGPIVNRFHVGADTNMAFNFDRYTILTTPGLFGTGNFQGADLGSGDRFGVEGLSLYVPAGYESGTSLFGTATYENETFESLGITPGTYVWTWGTGANADSLTLNIVPEPTSLMVLGIASVTLMRRRR